MATPLPEGVHIKVNRKCSGPDLEMTVMDASADHYSISCMLTGHRKAVMPTGTYYYYEGDVILTPPFIYHKTLFSSEMPYESVLIKFSPEFAEPFLQNIGQQIFEWLYRNRVFYFPKESSEKIKNMFLEMETEYLKERPYAEFILQGMLCRLLSAVWEEGIPRQQELSTALLTPPLIDAIAYMEKFYSRNPSLAETAREAGFSPSYFSRLFHHALGKSYSEYLNDIKLRHVMDLLVRSEKTVMEIAQETGYCHGNYLSNQFRNKTGMTPTQFRRRSRP